MHSDANRKQQLGRAQELRQLGESSRRKDDALARKYYEEATTLLRQFDEPVTLAHTLRHLGDVHYEQGFPNLAEPYYVEALELYRHYEKSPSLDLANAIRSLAILRWHQAQALWQEACDLYTTFYIEPGVTEATDRLAALSKN